MTAARLFLGMLALAQCVSAQNGAATLSGRVVNSVTKEGIPEVELSFCPGPPADASGPIIVLCDPSTALSIITDGSGSYSFRPPAGRYTVLPAVKRGFMMPPGAMSVVTVSGDTHRDFEMTPLAILHGRVLDPEGNPASGYVVALDSGCNGCTAMQVKISDQDGEFSFTDLAPIGSFVVSVSPKTQDPKAVEKIVTTYYPSAIERDLALPITAQGGDLFGYDIKLRTARAHPVKGVVLDDAGNPVPKALVSIVKPAAGIFTAIRGVPSSEPAETPLAEPTETLDDGTFTFPAVIEGSWTLRVVGGQPAHAGSAEVKVADQEVEDAVVRIAPSFSIDIQTDFGDSPPAGIPSIPVWMIPLGSPRLLPPIPGNVPPGVSPRFTGFAGQYVVAPAGLAGFYLAAVLLDNHDVLGQVTEIAAGDTIKLVFRKDGGSVRGTVEPGTVEQASEAMVVLLADPTPTGRLGYAARCDPSGAFAAQDVPPGEYTAFAINRSLDPASAAFSSVVASGGKRVKVEAGSVAQLDLRLASQ